jgi:ribA/ribD-fused uncharacterized protein
MIMTESPVVIAEFRGAWQFLSNFWPSPLTLPGYPQWTWPTAEHAYQVQKNHSLGHWAAIMGTRDPGEAKRIGRQAVLRPDWEAVKKRVMFDVVWAKFSYPDLAAMLLATGDADLREGNTWNDQYWGLALTAGGWAGHNYLGRILMAVRMLLRED